MAWPFALSTRLRSAPTNPRRLVVWSRTLELLDRGGGSAPFVDAGFKVDAVNMITGDKTIGHASMASVQSPYPYALMLPQSETERLLEERLRDLGVVVERQVELTTFNSGDDGVTAMLRHADGREESVSADWLIGCDGARQRRAPWSRRDLFGRHAGQRLDAGRRSHARLSLPRHRDLGVLASRWCLRHLPDLSRPISGCRRLATLRRCTSGDTDAGAGPGDHRQRGGRPAWSLTIRSGFRDSGSTTARSQTIARAVFSLPATRHTSTARPEGRA